MVNSFEPKHHLLGEQWTETTVALAQASPTKWRASGNELKILDKKSGIRLYSSS